ncbi:hypothetical protein [Methylosinus sp. KRF6]|uniref:hypothetical protein n=1 Tax=Methylosinus sp. KRF6 TaxID=2846853 RepID=UPI001C0BA98C|nr:hypothetical protein [Methylosinus sp. KRF6]MBU3889187.1 hypothetical protein [Methylosinus sp. KRF6]
MARGEASDGSDFEPFWAVRANAPSLAATQIMLFAIIPTPFLAFDIVSGNRPSVFLLTGLVVAFSLLFLLAIRMQGRRTIYVGSRRGICHCYCKLVGERAFAVQWTTHSVDYRLVELIRVADFFGANIITFELSFDPRPFRFSDLFGHRSRFGATKQYRGLVVEFDDRGVWTDHSRCGNEAPEIASSNAIEARSGPLGLFARIWRFVALSGGLCCDKEASRFVLERIVAGLPADFALRRKFRRG